jgi:HAD superfamily hydrolase (TIGR01509 family)
MTIKAIIFDMDGVLADLKEIHRDSFVEAYNSVSESFITKQAHDLYLCGFPTSVKLEKLGTFGKQAVAISKLKQEKTLELLSSLPPDIELQNMLTVLRKDYIILCCSNSLRKTVQLVLSKLGVLELFDAYFGNDDVIDSKPHHSMYRLAMAEEMLGPKDCLAIEDSLVGLETIRNVGCYGLWVKNRSELTLERIQNTCEIYRNV